MIWSPDKIKHYIVGFKLSRYVSILGFILTILAAISKELIWDYLLNKGTPEYDDFKATIIGGVDGFLFWKTRRF